MGVIETAILTLIMAVVVKMLENKITILVQKIKSNPFESFTVAGLCILIALSCMAVFF